MPVPEGGAHDVPITVSMHGAQSGIHKKRYERILKQEDLDTLWRDHREVKGNTSAETFDIDFKQMMVIALFAGDKQQNRGLLVKTCRDQGKEIVVRFQELSWQTSGVIGDSKETRTSPWGLVVIPKSSKKIIVEWDTQTNKNQPPEWERWAQFGALADK